MRRIGKSIRERSRELSAANPPAPTKNEDLSHSHEEISALQHVTRLFLSAVIEPMKEAHHGEIRWSRFEDMPYEATKADNTEGKKQFLLSRVASSKENIK